MAHVNFPYRNPNGNPGWSFLVPYKGALVGWLGLGLSDGGRKFSLGLYWVSVSSPVGQMRPGFSTPNSTPKCSLVSEFRMGGGLSCLVLGVLTEDGWAL